jgi:hypothetical protein
MDSDPVFFDEQPEARPAKNLRDNVSRYVNCDVAFLFTLQKLDWGPIFPKFLTQRGDTLSAEIDFSGA